MPSGSNPDTKSSGHRPEGQLGRGDGAEHIWLGHSTSIIKTMGKPWENGELMGLSGGLMDYEWDIPSGNLTLLLKMAMCNHLW